MLIPGIMEHIERAGVHSGDSMAVYPAPNLTPEEVETIVDYTVRTGLALHVTGLMNVQFVIMRSSDSATPIQGGSAVYVLEVNPRASRTVPFLSKVTGVPMVKVAINIMLGQSLSKQGFENGLYKKQSLVAVKAPVFSMAKLSGVDNYLGPEMKSTGEVMGVDYTFNAAIAKALLASGLMLPEKGAMLFSLADHDKPEGLPIIKKFASAGFKLFATEGTATAIQAMGLPVTMITKKISEGHPNVIDVITGNVVNGVLNTTTGDRVPLRDGFQIRRAAVEKGIPCYTSLDTARAVIEALSNGVLSFNIQPLRSYLEKHEEKDAR